jgi:putative FmdB family regulatory protein
MPLKDYKCESCGHEETDKIVKLADMSKVVVCIECGAVMVHLVGQTSFTLEGRSWFRDGYR